MLSCKKNKIMRRRFLSYDLFQTIIPVFAVSISAPLSTWKNAVHILTTRSRESGGINVGKYAVDIASSNYVCTMGDTQSIDCHMTPSGSGINCYFNNGNVTGDIYLTLVIIYKFTPVILVNKFLNRVIPKPCIGWHYCIPFYFSHNIITSVDISV